MLPAVTCTGGTFQGTTNKTNQIKENKELHGLQELNQPQARSPENQILAVPVQLPSAEDSAKGADPSPLGLMHTCLQYTMCNDYFGTMLDLP